jgi:hypothetical protein
VKIVTTQDIKELNQLKANYDEATATLAAYEKATFPHGKSDTLLAVECELKKRLAAFPAAYEENAIRVMANPGKAIDDTAAQLARDTKWHSDPKALPRVLSTKVVEALRKRVADAEKLTAGAGATPAELKEKLAALLEENEKRRTLRTERTFMLPDTYTGSDIAALKATAKAVVSKKFPAAAALRTTVVSKDWNEERVWEWTDTSKSAIRYRVTRSVSAQLAGKLQGTVFLYTIHVAQDRQTDGSWGSLHGHIMFTDPMLEKNVTK